MSRNLQNKSLLFIILACFPARLPHGPIRPANLDRPEKFRFPRTPTQTFSSQDQTNEKRLSSCRCIIPCHRAQLTLSEAAAPRRLLYPSMGPFIRDPWHSWEDGPRAGCTQEERTMLLAHAIGGFWWCCAAGEVSLHRSRPPETGAARRRRASTPLRQLLRRWLGCCDFVDCGCNPDGLCKEKDTFLLFVLNFSSEF